MTVIRPPMVYDELRQLRATVQQLEEENARLRAVILGIDARLSDMVKHFQSELEKESQ
jgi:hypothetical protein